MKKIIAVILLVSLSAFSQHKVIDVKIDSINFDDSNPKKRVYSINYHVENLTNNSISFFLLPNSLIANAASSMTLFPIYKLYVNGVFIPLDGPFFERDGWEEKLHDIKDFNSPEAKEIIKKVVEEYNIKNKAVIDNYKREGGKSTDENWILRNHRLMESIVTLNPREIRTFNIKTAWNKERYFKEEDLEYYLDEKDDYLFELVLDLKKTFFKEQLTPEEYSKLEKDKNFIQGVFTTNKATINFK